MMENRNLTLAAVLECNSDQLDFFGATPPAQYIPAPAAPDCNREALCRISHDLRTALNAVLGFSEIMTQRLHGPLGHPKYDEYADHVRLGGQALLAVSNEVLALAGRGLVPAGQMVGA